MEKKKVVVSFGTRPELIKLVPVIQALEITFDVEVWCTGQHTDLVNSELNLLGVIVTWNACISERKENNGLGGMLAATVNSYSKRIDSMLKPGDIMLVHGDTTSALGAAIAAKYAGLRVGHVEAGLRSGNKKSPFPEELNRVSIAALADFHFAPTELSKSNLEKEGINKGVFIVGNSVLDIVKKHSENLKINEGLTDVLITVHRRENIEFLDSIYGGISSIAMNNPNLKFLYPVHPNPVFFKKASECLGHIENIEIRSALDYSSFIIELNNSSFVITDSGGIQEEATFLNKPTLVARNETERVELTEKEGLFLAGTAGDRYLEIFSKMKSHVFEKQKFTSPLGNGDTGERIRDILNSL